MFGVVFRGFSRVFGGLFGVIEVLFWVIRTFFGCFCDRVCYVCARSEIVVVDGVRVDFVVFE